MLSADESSDADGALRLDFLPRARLELTLVFSRSLGDPRIIIFSPSATEIVLAESKELGE